MKTQYFSRDSVVLSASHLEPSENPVLIVALVLLLIIRKSQQVKNPTLWVLSMKKEMNGYPKRIISWNIIDEVKQEAMQAVLNQGPHQNTEQKQREKYRQNLGF